MARIGIEGQAFLRSGLAAAALLAASGLVPGRAHACSCFHGPGPSFLLPENGGVAPANTLVWIGNSGITGTFELRDGMGAPVQVTITRITEAAPPMGEMVVLTPAEPLMPGEHYEVVARANDGIGTQQQLLGAFDVTQDHDADAPRAPEITDIEARVNDDEGNSCGKSRGVNITAEGEGLVVMRLGLADTSEDLEPDPPDGSVDLLLPGHDGQYEFGFGGPCVAWPSSSEVIAVQLASFDLAGNFSGWSEPETIRRPQFDGFLSCTVRAPGREASGARGVCSAGLILLALALRQRRRRSAF